MEAVATQALLSAVTDLCSRAGHDLLGPLNQAGSLVTLFVRRYTNRLDSEADDLLKLLESSSAKMECTVAGVRKYMEIASRPPLFEPVDLNDSFASSLMLLKEEISESGAVVVSDTLPIVSADACLMVTLCEILIGNSIKFRRQGVPPRIQVSKIKGGITVTDNGIGIDPQYRESVLLPFIRTDGRKYAGAGLGLPMAKLIAEMHGGSIRIEPGLKGSAGACVRVALTAD
jgi:light-regulated signal transduction histidine kinase (bacteriophytochrome)